MLKKNSLLLFFISLASVNSFVTIVCEAPPASAVHSRKILGSNKKKSKRLKKLFTQRWSWLSICDFAYANESDGGGEFRNATPFNPKDVFPGSIVFSTAYGIEEFLEKIHPQIENPYILVTLYYGPVMHMAKYVNDPKIIAWFGMNNRDAVTFEKFTTIPLGILRDEQLFYESKNIYKQLQQLKNVPKTELLFMNFTVHEGRYDGRSDIYNMFKNQPFCLDDVPTAFFRRPFMEYMTLMARYKFALSPTGDMYDCYRHWEAMLVGTIPIIQHTSLDPMFEDLPVILVDDFKEVTQEFLERKYDEMKIKHII